MSILLPIALTVSLAQTTAPSTGQTMSQRREVLQAQVAITTLTPAELKTQPAKQEIEHDTEVSRSESITAVVTIQNCQSDPKGVCQVSADVVTYKPDGTVHSEMKNVDLSGSRGLVAVKLVPEDVTGLYRVVATVRDVVARRIAKVERIFGVK